jgi:hypothetical protein
LRDSVVRSHAFYRCDGFCDGSTYICCLAAADMGEPRLARERVTRGVSPVTAGVGRFRARARQLSTSAQTEGTGNILYPTQAGPVAFLDLESRRFPPYSFEESVCSIAVAGCPGGLSRGRGGSDRPSSGRIEQVALWCAPRGACFTLAADHGAVVAVHRSSATRTSAPSRHHHPARVCPSQVGQHALHRQTALQIKGAHCCLRRA